jgi:hypothetical protein
VARKDRAAARRRHAIDRARREAGDEPTPKPKPKPPPGNPSSRARTNGGRASGGKGSAGPLRKLQVGDVDRRGRVFTRNMVLHPRVALRIYIVVLAVAVVSLFRRELVGASYLAFAVGMLVIADSQATWKRATPYVILAGLLAGAAIVVIVAGLTGRV